MNGQTNRRTDKPKTYVDGVLICSKMSCAGSYRMLGEFFYDTAFYHLRINDTSFELSVFWLSDTESWIFYSVSLSFKTRLTSVTCFLRRCCVKLISSMEPETENMTYGQET